MPNKKLRCLGLLVVIGNATPRVKRQGVGAIVLDLLHAHRVSLSTLRVCSLNLFAIRTNFVSSVRKSARTRIRLRLIGFLSHSDICIKQKTGINPVFNFINSEKAGFEPAVEFPPHKRSRFAP